MQEFVIRFVKVVTKRIQYY